MDHAKSIQPEIQIPAAAKYWHENVQLSTAVISFSKIKPVFSKIILHTHILQLIYVLHSLDEIFAVNTQTPTLQPLNLELIIA